MKDYDTRKADIERWFAELVPRVLQSNVQVRERFANSLMARVHLNGANLTVILEVECHDGQLWAHLSVGGTKGKRVPSWAELGWCKRYFIGDRKALQVLPKQSEYVNRHPFVLHLWAPLEHDPLPDFRHTTADGETGI